MAARKKFGRMKPKGRRPGFERLRGLRCFEEIHERVKQGWPTTELARWIQEDREEYQDVSRSALVSVLTNYRGSIPPGELVEKRLPKAFVEAKEKIESGLDELVELEELYRLQMERVKIDFEKEKLIDKLLPTMTNEIKEARALLEAMFGLKAELGIITRSPQEHNVNIHAEVEGQFSEDIGQFASEAVQGVLGDAESRRRVTGVVDRFLRMSEKTESEPA